MNDAILPRSVDVVVIGGGIVGCSAAYRLATSGLTVLLCEKGRIGGEQSSRNWGWVRIQGRDRREIPLMIESHKIWSGLSAEIGEDIGYVRAGCLYLASNVRELQRHETWLPTAVEFGLDTQIISGSTLDRLLPGSSSQWSGALYTPSDGRAEPTLVAPALARAAARRGAVIATECAVRGLSFAAGSVDGVVTEHGPVKTSLVVCAGGAWVGRFCASIGLAVPQLLVKGTVACTSAGPNVLEGTAWSRTIALRRRQDGGYTVAHGSAVEHFIGMNTFRHFRKFLPSLITQLDQVRLRVASSPVQEWGARKTWPLDAESPFEQVRVLDPMPNPLILGEMRRALQRLFPAIGELPFARSWAGMIEASPDAVPILSGVEKLSGFFVATGFSGHGFGIGPAAGHAVADLAIGRSPSVGLSAFRLSRFFDGTPIEPGPGI